MTGEKIYECDLDITGVTDYGVSMESILQAKKRSRRKGRASMWLLREMQPAAYRVECAASIISGCAPTDA
jgi:hypothetical protein